MSYLRSHTVYDYNSTTPMLMEYPESCDDRYNCGNNGGY